MAQPQGVSKFSSEEKTFTRRRVVAGLMTSAGGVGAYAYYGARPALAITSNFASDISISTADGKITDVSLGSNLSVTLSWDGLDATPDNADVSINVKTDDTGGINFSQLVGVTAFTLSDNSLSGSETLTASDFGTAPFSIIDANGGIKTSDFEATTDGGTKDTTVTLQVTATIYDSSNNQIETTSSTDSYVVSVTNTSSSSSTSGTADTQASG